MERVWEASYTVYYLIHSNRPKFSGKEIVSLNNQCVDLFQGGNSQIKLNDSQIKLRFFLSIVDVEM